MTQHSMRYWAAPRCRRSSPKPRHASTPERAGWRISTRPSPSTADTNAPPRLAGAPTMTRYPFEYVVVRVVPRVERGESINAGVVVYCQELNYLGARTHLDADRLRALDPTADLDALETALRALTDTCASAGHRPGCGGGDRATLPPAHRTTQHGRPARPGAHGPDDRPRR